jgi:Domain of unknown function (DUF4178)
VPAWGAVSGYEARCPSCGAPVVFRLGATLLKVCDHCGVAVARKGANLATYGRVAELIPTPSVLALGVGGRYSGAPSFTLVGRLQLDYGAGTWDEWLMAFDGDRWAWLSEAQGRFHYMGLAALPPSPEFEDLRVGHTLDLGPPGTFVVTEVREARFMTAAGELPFDVRPGSLLRYADLSGPGGQLATLDYGTGSTAEALYVGRQVTLEELGVSGLPHEEDRRKKTTGQNLSCPQCGGPLEIRAPDQAQRVACPYCGSMLDATRDLAVLEALARVDVQPRIPLGSKGRLQGREWAVIGFLERSVTVEGVRYPWQEYLLYEARHGFRWLVESKGHWSFVEPISAADVQRQGDDRARYDSKVFRHFQGGEATVDVALGEFYWAVARGDRVSSQDYVCPPLMLSSEADDQEINWSLGHYTPPADIWKAFGLVGGPPAPEGVAPHQPSPYAGKVWPVFSLALLATVMLFVVYLGIAFSGGRVVHKQSVTIPSGVQPASPEAALFTDRFFVQEQGNLEVAVNAPVSNTWLYLDGALINEETGAVDEFDMEVSYYYGSDSDGAWSEGSNQARAYIAAVPPGRYLLRLGPQWEAGRPAPSYQLQVKSRVPRLYQLGLATAALFAWPLLLGWRSMRFEAARWSESDHVSTGGGDDDSGGNGDD